MQAKTQMKPGIYHDMPDADYRAIDAVSKSDLDQWISGEERVQTREMELGTVFHLAMLEPAKAKQLIRVGPEVDLRKPADKAIWAEAVAANVGYHTLRPKELASLVEMSKSTRANPDVAKVRDAEGRCEVVAVWHDGESDLLCKAKIDKVCKRALVDFKTTGGDRDFFEKAIPRFGYLTQAAYYVDGYAKAMGGDEPDLRAFLLVPVSKKPPHPCWVRRVTDWELEIGRKHARDLLRLYKRHIESIPF